MSESPSGTPSEVPSTAPRSRARLWGILAAVGAAVLAGGIYWAVYADRSNLRDDLASGDADRMRDALVQADTEKLRGKDARATRQLTMEAMRKMSIEDLMSLWRDDSLTDEQRRQMGENMRVIWMSYMTEFAEEYFTVPEEEKEKLLDQRIDEWKEFMDRMREWREAHQDDPEYQQRREQERERWRRRQRSTEERKQQMAEINPDQQAKMFYVFQQMRKRAEERGLDMSWGRGRGRDRGDDQERDRERRPRRERRGD